MYFVCRQIVSENLEDLAIFLSLSPPKVLSMNPPDPVAESACND